MDRKSFIKKAGLGSAGLMGSTATGGLGMLTGFKNKNSRPNIMVIMADDMGFSDIGCYGGEIDTPNLDGLASNGLRFSQFYNAARCCPTRASLLTGLYPHQTGIGLMTNDLRHDSYRGDLNNNCVTIAEALGTSGYNTWMSGKWHVTKHIGVENKNPDKHNWPRQRGFDRFFGTIIGAGSYYNPITLARDNEPIEAGPDFYYTDAISDNAVSHIDEYSKDDNKEEPFFGYVAYTAPHWPLHALEEDIAKYEGEYVAGWDQIRSRRRNRMVDLGLIDSNWPLTERDPRVPAWENAEDKEWEQRRMEVYAAQIDRMDQGIGRIIQSLERNGQLDDTLILFLADNGGCAETLEGWGDMLTVPKRTRDGQPVDFGNQSDIMPGGAITYQSYGIGWANASDTPFRLYKHYVHEGGISSPFIAHWPQGIKEDGAWRSHPSHLIDLMSTCVELGQADYPTEFNNQPIEPMEGKSLASIFEQDQVERGESLCWEHHGNRAIRADEWKLVQRHDYDWELYNMHEDRTEKEDRSSEKPNLASDLKGQYEEWANRIEVLPWPAQEYIKES